MSGPLYNYMEERSRVIMELVQPWMKAIQTPHEHEHPEHNPPIWLLWKITTDSDGLRSFPVLDTVCTTEDSAIVHVYMILEERNPSVIAGAIIPGGIYTVPGKDVEIFVERVPGNHRFASSLPKWQMQTYHSVRSWRRRNELDGD